MQPHIASGTLLPSARSLVNHTALTDLDADSHTTVFSSADPSELPCINGSSLREES
jgi:hypothetical protein